MNDGRGGRSSSSEGGSLNEGRTGSSRLAVFGAEADGGGGGGGTTGGGATTEAGGGGGVLGFARGGGGGGTVGGAPITVAGGGGTLGTDGTGGTTAVTFCSACWAVRISLVGGPTEILPRTIRMSTGAVLFLIGIVRADSRFFLAMVGGMIAA